MTTICERATKMADGVTRWETRSVSECVVDALADYGETDAKRQDLNAHTARVLNGRDSWGHSFTRSSFLAQLSDPSSRLREAVETMRAQLVDSLPLPTTPRRRVRHGQDYGDEISSDRFLARQPNVWTRNVREATPRRTIRIACNLAVSCAMRPENLLWRGAVVVALADVLTQRGLNVEVAGFFVSEASTEGTKLAVAKVTVKTSDMPVDLGAITFALCEIAFARVAVLSGAMRHYAGRANGGWGCVRPLPAAERKEFDFVIDANVIGRQAAEAWLAECLAAVAE